jgi:hypothetical protein
VLSWGVWQCAHPIALNVPRPRWIDGVPPGASTDATGGARKREKNANF